MRVDCDCAWCRNFGEVAQPAVLIKAVASESDLDRIEALIERAEALKVDAVRLAALEKKVEEQGNEISFLRQKELTRERDRYDQVFGSSLPGATAPTPPKEPYRPPPPYAPRPVSPWDRSIHHWDPWRITSTNTDWHHDGPNYRPDPLHG